MNIYIKQTVEQENWRYLKESSGVADVVPNEALGGDSDFIVVDRSFGLLPRHFLIPIHGSSLPYR